MKQLLLICAVVALVGCGTTQTPTNPNWVSDPSDPNNVKIEAAIRREVVKHTGELTKADLDKLEVLYLEDNQLTSLENLGKLTNLERLMVYRNNLVDANGLEKLTKLWTVSFQHNQLTDVKDLDKLTQLKELWLNGNKLTDVKGLEKLTQLTNLHLYGNKLTDVKGLEKLTQLKKLYLKDNPDLTKVQIDELQKALPECFIISNPKK